MPKHARLASIRSAVEEIAVRPDTFQRLAVIFERFPEAWAGEPVADDEIDRAEARLGVHFAADFRTFIARYGGGHAGSLPVAGLRRWEAAGRDEWSVVELTEFHRTVGWPGTDVWAVFSGDGFGNPIGIDKSGRVWVSDKNSRECVCLEATFEDWLRRWALNADPHRAGGHLEQWAWPA
jgi:hypothetical protein